MKSLRTLAVAVTFLPVLAQATSLHPDTFNNTAPIITKLKVSSVAEQGKILRERRNHPYTNFLIAIPVTVNTGDVCTAFVGQTTNGLPQVEGARAVKLAVLGSRNVMHEICTQQAPEPVETELTFEINVLTGGFVPPTKPIHRQLVQIESAGLYSVVVDYSTERVTIKPMFELHE